MNLMGRWRARRARKKSEFREDPIGGLRNSVKFLMLGGCMAILVILLGSLVVFHFQDLHDKERAEQLKQDVEQREQERIDRSVEACHNYNEDQTNDRATATQAIPQMAVSFFDKTQEEADALLQGPGGKAFVKFVEGRNPYRQCSVKCVVANTTPGATKCPPAINEQGDPP